MILNGAIAIEHKNHHKKQLHKFDMDAFEGDWETTSKGICTDFNLMCSQENSGKISAHKLIADTRLSLNLNANSKFYCFYVYKGAIEIQEKTINAGDMFILSKFTVESIELIASYPSEVILTEIY
jgi:environmental stress-induced protein Ves